MSLAERYHKRQLAAKAIQSPPLPLQGIDHVHGSDSLPLGMFSVGNRIPDHVLEEHLENCLAFYNTLQIYLQNTPSLLIDESTDPFDAAPSCKSTDCRLGDALYNRISEDTRLKITLPGCYLSTPCDAS